MIYSKDILYDDYYPDYGTLDEYSTAPNDPFFLVQVAVIGLAALISFIGNSAVVALIATRTSLHKIPYFYILNRAAGDILNSAITPLLLISAVKGNFVFGSIICKLLNCLIQISISMSNIFFSYLVYDCYLKCRNHTLAYRNKLLKIISGVNWAIAFLFCIPIYIFTEFHEFYDNADCLEIPLFSRLLPVANVLAIFGVCIAPLIVIFTYIGHMYRVKSVKIDGMEENTKRYRHLVIALTVTFSICQIPYWFLELALHIYPLMSFIYQYNLHYITLPLLHVNAAVNAILYILYIEDLKSIVFFWRRNTNNHDVPLEEMAPH